MTDYQREHQYDEWAMNLDWPNASTYEEAGTATSYITKLVNSHWKERDTEDSKDFWDREFREGLKAAKEAKAKGLTLQWTIDPEEI